MIKLEQLTNVGKVGKSHGLDGEFAVIFTLDFDLDEPPFLIFDIDGIFVPFQIKNFRYFTDTKAYVRIKGITSEMKARQLYGSSVYVDSDQIGDSEVVDTNTLSVLLDFEVCDLKMGVLGKVTHVDEKTANVLIEIDEDRLIPAAFVKWDVLDMDSKKLIVDIPAELWDINL